MGQIEFKSNRFISFAVGMEDGCSPPSEGFIKEAGRETFSPWNFESLFNILLPFSLCGSNRSGIA
jgi:hypothetical protein